MVGLFFCIRVLCFGFFKLMMNSCLCVIFAMNVKIGTRLDKECVTVATGMRSIKACAAVHLNQK